MPINWRSLICWTSPGSAVIYNTVSYLYSATYAHQHMFYALNIMTVLPTMVAGRWSCSFFLFLLRCVCKFAYPLLCVVITIEFPYKRHLMIYENIYNKWNWVTNYSRPQDKQAISNTPPSPPTSPPLSASFYFYGMFVPFRRIIINIWSIHI